MTPEAFLSDNVLTVSLPEGAVLAWAMTEQAVIRGEQLLEGGDKLDVIVEKDRRS